MQVFGSHKNIIKNYYVGPNETEDDVVNEVVKEFGYDTWEWKQGSSVLQSIGRRENFIERFGFESLAEGVFTKAERDQLVAYEPRPSAMNTYGGLDNFM